MQCYVCYRSYDSNEDIICTVEDEPEMLERYFKDEPGGRKLDDYDRIEQGGPIVTDCLY